MQTRTWFLLKASDLEVYGPTDLDMLQQWASEAKISPLDKISSDGRRTWQRAPMIEALQMDHLVQMEDDYLYGPTNVATIQEFLATGEIDEDVRIINCRTNDEKRLGEMSWFQDSPHKARSKATTFVGTQWPSEPGRRAPKPEGSQLRVAALERQTIELQRSLDQWQQAYKSLRQQFLESTGREPI